MNTFLKYLLAAVVVLACVGGGAFAGCVAGFAVSARVASGSEDRFMTGVVIGMSVGALLGLVGGAFVAAKVINPPRPPE